LEQISAQSEESFALCSFETGQHASSCHPRQRSLEPCRQTILASDAVQRLFGETLVIVISRATIVNHGQIDGRRVCVSVNPFGSLHAALRFSCVLIIARIAVSFVHRVSAARARQLNLSINKGLSLRTSGVLIWAADGIALPSRLRFAPV
jgi:hypothetical protein